MVGDRKRYRYPWRDGNQVRLLCDGDAFYAAMLASIDDAEKLIFLEMYLVESGHVAEKFIKTLLRAADRRVKVYILLDDFGSRYLHTRDRNRLVAHPNISLHFYNTLHYGRWRRALFRDHRKLLLVDGHVAYVGGAGLADEFQRTELPWRETMLRVSGPCVSDWVEVFTSLWERSTDTSIPIDSEKHALTFENGVLGRVTTSSWSSGREIKRSLIKHARGAERRVWLATAYFVPSIKIRRALARAARRGVDVRLLLAGRHTDHPAVRLAGRRYYYALLRAGVRIFEYQPRFTHAKVQMCDGWVSIGSSNVDRWNFRWNLEANQEIDDDGFAKEVADMFLRDFDQCVEIDLKRWTQRPWYWRWLEWGLGKIDVLLDRIFNRV